MAPSLRNRMGRKLPVGLAQIARQGVHGLPASGPEVHVPPTQGNIVAFCPVIRTIPIPEALQAVEPARLVPTAQGNALGIHPPTDAFDPVGGVRPKATSIYDRWGTATVEQAAAPQGVGQDFERATKHAKQEMSQIVEFQTKIYSNLRGLSNGR